MATTDVCSRYWRAACLAAALNCGSAWGAIFEFGEAGIVAGGGLGDGGSALTASLLPRDVLAGPDGTLYIADEQSNRVRAVSPGGEITTVVGSGRYGGDDLAVGVFQGSLSIPDGLDIAPDGTLYIVDLGNRQIRRVSDGVLQPFVDPGHPIFSTVHGRFAPASVAVGPNGKVHVADRGTHIVWQFDPDGSGRKAAGNGTRGYGGDGGPSALGQLSNPVAVAVGVDRSIYIADRGNRRVRKVDPNGTLNTIAGNGSDAPWEGEAAALGASVEPIDVALELNGDLLVLDALGNRLLRLASSRLSVVARFAATSRPKAITVKPDGDIVVADYGSRQVTVLDRSEVLAGNGTIRASGDGDDARNASLYQPFGLDRDSHDNLYFADRLNHLVRRVSPDGTIETVAGTGAAGAGGDGGPALEAQLNRPTGVAVDASDRVLVADEGNHRIRRIDRGGTIHTVAGTGAPEFTGDGGPATGAGLRHPTGLTFDATGRLVIADSGNRRVRRVDADGAIITIAGNGDQSPVGSGGPALEVALVRPADVVGDGRGGLLITDSDAHRVYRLDATGLLVVVAGTGEEGRSESGSIASHAALSSPLGATPDGAGGVFVADAGNGRVGHVSADGLFTSLEMAGAGQPARLLLVDGRLVFSDILNHRILEQELTRLTQSASDRVVFHSDAADEYSIQMVAALEGSVSDVVFDPVAKRLYVTDDDGVEEILPGGGRRAFAEFSSPITSAVPITGAYERGLVVGTTSAAVFGTGLTVLERHWKGWMRFLPIERPTGPVYAAALSPGGDLFAITPGRLIRFLGSTWPTAGVLWEGPEIATQVTRDDGHQSRDGDATTSSITGFLGEEVTTGNARALTAADVLRRVSLEDFASLPHEDACLTITAGGVLYVALKSSMELLRLRDLDGDGSANGAGEMTRVASFVEEPVSIAAQSSPHKAEAVFVATTGGMIHRYDAERDEMRVFASGFTPEIRGISSGPGGSLYVLEGDAASSRLMALAPATRILAVWPEEIDFGSGPLGKLSVRTVILRNDGATPLLVAAESATSAAFEDGDQRLEPGQQVEVSVALAPPSAGSVDGEIVWRDEGDGGTILARQQIAMRGLAPQLVIADQLAMGTVWLGGEASRNLTLRNSGDWPLQISQLQLADDGGESALPFTARLAGDATIEPGHTGEIVITFNPSARQQYAGTLSIHANDPVAPIRTVSIKGTGGRAELVFPSVYDLGAVRVGSRRTDQWKLTNTGELDLDIRYILTGNRRIILTPRRLLIKPGETRAVEVEFSPDELRVYEGEFRLLTNDPRTPDWRLAFLGRGVSSLIELSAVSHRFEPAAVGEARRWQLEMTNFQPRVLSVLRATTNSRQFRVVDRPTRLEPEETGTFEVEYRPSRQGSSRAIMTIETDLQSARRIEVALSGRARSASAVAIWAPPGEGPRSLWPGEIVRLPLRIEGAARLKGVALQLAGPFEELEFAGMEYPPESLFGQLWTQPLTVWQDDGAGKLQIGISLTGPQAATGLSGSGLLGVLKLRMRGPLLRASHVVAIEQVTFKSVLGGEDALTSPTPVAAAELDLRLKGDFDGDGLLGFPDLFMLADAVGVAVAGEFARFDLNGDGLIGKADANLLMEHMPNSAAAKASTLTGALFGLPAELAVRPAHPNPFNSETTLTIELPAPQFVELAIYNTLGQPVRHLVSQPMRAGVHTVVWDGTNDAGQELTTGIYIHALTNGSHRATGRVLLLR